MRFLLDTHSFLWFNSGNKELSSSAEEFIRNPQNDILVSVASLWEISIKNSLKKLVISGGFESVQEDLTSNGFQILPIEFKHLIRQNKLEFIHGDPFDRLLISQSIEENIDIIGRDSIFDAYFRKETVKRIW